MTMLHRFSLAALFVLCASDAAAQVDRRPRCAPSPAPFATTAENQVRGDALHRLLAGRTMVYTRPGRAPDGREMGEVRFRLEFRADGSTTIQCQTRRASAGPWRACRNFGAESGQVPDRDVGTWRVGDDQLVLQRTRFGLEESRVALHSQAGALAVRRVAGAPCMPGPVALE